MSQRFRFLHGRDIAALSGAARRQYAREAFQYWRVRGFPFPTMTRLQMLRAYRALAASAKPIFLNHRELQWSPVGLGLANNFQPHIWSTKCERFRTPIEVFNNDEMFRAGINRALEMWRDRRSLAPNNVRRMAATFTNTKRVSNFRPSVAKALCERYSREGDLVVDPAAGYGGRLLGCLPLNRRYLGIEPNRKSIGGLRSMVATLKRLVPIPASVRLIRGCAEDILPTLECSTSQLALCSPPYYARERYSTDGTQSYVRYGSYGAWVEGFLEPLIYGISRVLRPRGFLALNVANTESHPIADDAKRIARCHFKAYYTYRLRIGSVPYHRNGHRGGHRSEPLFIFQKR
jgi:tRNA G10  N-methylase Trm11